MGQFFRNCVPDFRWTVLKLLGSGGFGDVYKVVKEENQDRKVEYDTAMKIIHRNTM